MNPQQSVRIKYVNDSEETVEARVTGSGVPRVGEKVRILGEEMYGGEWFVVEDVWWTVVNSPERKPDVAEVRLAEPDEDTSSNTMEPLPEEMKDINLGESL